MNYIKSFFESLPQERSVKQLKRLRRKTKKVTIDDKQDKKIIANQLYIRNPIDTGIQSYQDFMKSHK